MSYVNPKADSATVLWQTLLGSKWRVRLSDPTAEPGRRSGQVVDADGEVIGDASDYTYGGCWFAVHTPAYGGVVAVDQIEFV